MAKIDIKSERITPFGGIFSIMEQFDRSLSSVIDSTIGLRSRILCKSSRWVLRIGNLKTPTFIHIGINHSQTELLRILGIWNNFVFFISGLFSVCYWSALESSYLDIRHCYLQKKSSFNGSFGIIKFLAAKLPDSIS